MGNGLTATRQRGTAHWSSWRSSIRCAEKEERRERDDRRDDEQRADPRATLTTMRRRTTASVNVAE
jgi:hypothetical protein